MPSSTHDPGDRDRSAPQVAHPDSTRSLVDATRALIAAQRTADAPVDTLARATALVQQATELLAPHQVDGVPGQNALRARFPDREQFASGDPARFFPYSPVVGPLNALAPPVVFRFDGERMHGSGTLDAPYTGPPGTVHGGVVALVLDELLGAVNACLGLGAYTGTLTIRYERPTPIGEELAFDAWVDRTEGRKVFTVGTIRADGGVTARAEGVFIRVETPVPADGVAST
jgi:acyl-coenzyme A thioesterase PaaI-like protein